MQRTDFQRFRAVMNGMAKIYERELDTVVLDAYWLCLGSWTLNDFEAAAAHLMRTSKFMPRPSDFTALEKAGELTASEAWAEVLGYCSQWRHPDQLPKGRIARAAQSVGGFRTIAMADIEHALPHIERRFKEAYEELSEVEPIRQALPQIAFDDVLKLPEGPKGRLAKL